jgi:BlaI family penicillinase repressor
MQPTNSELEILKQFWQHGAQSARELHDRIGSSQDWSISTTRTVLERMKAKGLLDRQSLHGVGVYTAANTKVQVLGAAIRSFTRRVLEVDGEMPISAFSGSALLNDADLAEIAELINGKDDTAC